MITDIQKVQYMYNTSNDPITVHCRYSIIMSLILLVKHIHTYVRNNILAQDVATLYIYIYNIYNIYKINKKLKI